ncbi:MAG TPA: hypothetical protein VMV69_09025 [Pirellulales bacterium]|nr:hypothetical protein [Pirellulales bacterium]
MALNQRERRLALGTGALLTVALVQFGYHAIQSAFDERQTRIGVLNQEIKNKDITVLRGHKAAKKLQAWRIRSLPSDLELARSLYKNWLAAIVERNELAQADVTLGADAPKPGIYTLIPVTIRGKGRLEQILRLLHEIYQSDQLQLVKQISLTPLAEGGAAGGGAPHGRGGLAGGGFGGGPRFDLTLMVEALALPGAEHKSSLNEAKADKLAWTDFAQYRQPILARNLFAAYRPVEEGDPARDTFVTAVTGDDDDFEAWILVRSTGRLMKLEEGDTFDVGKLEAKVGRIARQSVDIESGGKRRRVRLGSSLSDGRELP